MLATLFTLASLIFLSSAPAAEPAACGLPGGLIQNPTFTFVKSTPAGRVHICGEGKAQKMHGHAYLEKEGRLLEIPEKEIGALGYVTDAYAPFNVGYVAFAERPNGFSVTELVPYGKDEDLPALRREVTCTPKGCRTAKAKCVFKKPKGEIDKAAVRRLQKAWRNPGLSQQMAAVSADIEQEMAGVAGLPKEAAPPKAGGDEYQDDLMIVYRNALLGHRDSRKLLLDPKTMKRLAEAEGEGSGGGPHEVVNGTLARLRTAGCLR